MEVKCSDCVNCASSEVVAVHAWLEDGVHPDRLSLAEIAGYNLHTIGRQEENGATPSDAASVGGLQVSTRTTAWMITSAALERHEDSRAILDQVASSCRQRSCCRKHCTVRDMCRCTRQLIAHRLSCEYSLLFFQQIVELLLPLLSTPVIMRAKHERRRSPAGKGTMK